ncbi:uncharacterized protein LOC131321248 [Rhododendron vialii]|uniref:uncharacterized protein LOC131321248 n=1 Tax=Rhododendron vialii TaxID=182163 RepID=UPI00265E6404|nr:uncharacterized protein LOC131321248 [Rhododendron vialii]
MDNGDKNTKFFHASVMQQRACNRISGIEVDNGNWTSDPQEVKTEFQRFFSGIFTAGPNLQMHDTVEVIPHKISAAMNHSLVRPVTDSEILSALKGMGPTKAPGVDENQSAIIEGRQISNSILIAHELMHSLKNRRHGKTGWVALKLDMAKAFDRIEWSYLEAVLCKFGFADQWIQWVMSCVSTVSFATVINEGFHYLLQSVDSAGTLHGVKIGQFCPSISHLFFVDDSVLFWEATASGYHASNEVLQKYEATSGQLVNRDKSSLFFSPNAPSNVKEGISNSLNITCEIQGGKYLGLPSIIGKSKTEVFKYVKDRVFNRLQNWKDSTLNMAGKEVLIKLVALTMPNYVMQCFLFPKRVCKDICCAIRKFWWGSKEGENKINWGWRLLQGPPSLFLSLFKGKYFYNRTFWEASCPSSASWAWRSILAGRAILRKGWRWNVRDGSSIDVWCDPWLPRSLLSWNVSLIKDLFSESDVDSILSIPISSQGCGDKGLWHYTNNGSFSVKSAYRLAKQCVSPQHSRERGESSLGIPSDSFWKSLWSLPILNKIKMFLWRCSHNAIAVFANLNYWWYSFPHNSLASDASVDMGAFCASICWFIWKTRNLVHFDGLNWDGSMILDKASTLCSEFKAVQVIGHSLRSLATSGSVPMWRPPLADVVKFNVDGAVQQKNGSVGIGIVARDHMGQIVGILATSFPGLLSPKVVEVLAFLEALVFTANRGLSNFVVEGDSLEVVQALTQSEKSFADCSSILLDCLVLLPLFSSCSFVNVNRSCNRVAYSLAKRSLLGISLENWGVS